MTMRPPASPRKPTMTPIAASLRAASWPAPAKAPERPAEPPPPAEAPCTPPKNGASEADQPVAAKSAQIRLVKTIGRRMKEAREELAGMSQQQAAELLGYANPSKLSKIEGATDTNSVPLLTILRAAEIYDVSIDYLFGLTDDWERDPRLARERAVGRWLLDNLQKTREQDAAAFANLAKKFHSIEQLMPALAASAESVLAALQRLADLNPGFDDLIGGAKLLAAAASLEQQANTVRLALARLKVELAPKEAAHA